MKKHLLFRCENRTIGVKMPIVYVLNRTIGVENAYCLGVKMKQ